MVHKFLVEYRTCGATVLRSGPFLLVCFLLSVLVILTIYPTGKSKLTVEVSVKHNDSKGREPSQEQCNLFSGKWVFDDNSYPVYREKQCSFMTDDFACEKFGRKDFGYQHWRWQPHHCDLPRFNSTAFLGRLRNKRLVFVGDSISRNQWMSMVCMVESNIPPILKSVHFDRSFFRFHANEYNTTIDFYWSPYLVESNADDLWSHHNITNRIVRIQAIENHAKHWTDADALVFGTYLWWRYPTIHVLWGSFNGSDGIYKDVEMLRCYEMALQTWSDWLEIQINRSKTQLFFLSMSPTHQWSADWGMPADQKCYNEKEPIYREEYQGRETLTYANMMRAVEAVIEKLKKRGLNVQMLNITQLSDYRKDGHPSIYRKFWHSLSQDQLSNPPSYADCGHWCLPGVPDAWNEILYAYMAP